MGIKETPTNFRTYYKTMRDSIRPKYEKAVEEYDKLSVEETNLYKEVFSKKEIYNVDYKFNLDDYEEFTKNEYIDGTFYNHAKGLFVNKKNNYTATTILYKLYKLAREQKELHEQHHNIINYEQMLDLSLSEYSQILEAFYIEVHKKMILEGYGYVMENPLGWICINRCKIKTKRKVLDFAATKENKKKLLAEGKRLWNKDEADYARTIGVEYNGVDYRVYLNEDYCYEFALINCRVTKGEKCRFEPCARRKNVKGRTNAQIIADCDNDVNKICELPLDIRRKLYLCLESDNILYLNFIRNEAQQSYHTPKANRED